MMGASHAVSGAAAWVALTSTAPIALGTHPLEPQGVILGALVTAGAALLPDADHHSATIARSGGFLTRGLAGAAGAASGGHRHGLHTALAAVGAALLTGFADRLTATVPLLGTIPLGSALVLLALVAFANKALDLGRSGVVNLWAGAALVTVAVLAWAPEQLEWLPQAVLVGFVVHLVGDLVTTGGLPLLWPFLVKPPRRLRKAPVLRRIWLANGYVALPVLGRTGSAREQALTAVLSLYAGALVVVAAGQLIGRIGSAASAVSTGGAVAGLG
ncbi:metal-dependent hydrolase [Sanguibacter inulinus]|uniref:Metal-dependent hydrolase n=1 Tax=Sanguibacter inulinus TaxID=60922 RepID=A0A853EUE6_9MICO|nr:metal-dependent hydrolase [Sanguibacter inulinus]MBF0722157.1 metal-dependent hydrolase [Sanguibacter inulinus]NYS93302.1 metal-dependent hydrolase [Sanguibacter inulinus]